MAHTIRTTKDAGLVTAERSALTIAELNDITAAAPVATAVSATQGTSKATTVVASGLAGTLTLHAASLAAATIVSFTWTNTYLVATDMIELEHVSGGTAAAYSVACFPGAGTSTVSVRNNTAGALAEAIVIRFKVTKTA